jgi:hypothetical protein
VSFKDPDQDGEMIIFESILTTFEASFIFPGSWGSRQIGLSLKLNHRKQI